MWRVYLQVTLILYHQHSSLLQRHKDKFISTVGKASASALCCPTEAINTVSLGCLSVNGQTKWWLSGFGSDRSHCLCFRLHRRQIQLQVLAGHV